jgi:protein-tyrosine kinase
MNSVTSITPLLSPASVGASRTIGDILVASGRLNPDDAARILAHQKQNKLKFGDAAISLELLDREDIDFALSKQFEYSYLLDQDTSLSPQLVAAYKPFSRVGENLRAVRSQLQLRWFDNNPARKVLAVVSAGKKEGRSFIAANLAIVFAQQGERTLLIDGDLRASPGNGQQSLFQLDTATGLSGVLAGRGGLESAQPIAGLPSLVVLSAGALPPNPQELLGRAAFADILQTASHQFEVIIIDTPSATDYADAEIIASRAGAALMVTRVNMSIVPQTARLARRLQDSGVAMVGCVLNVV